MKLVFLLIVALAFAVVEGQRQTQGEVSGRTDQQYRDWHRKYYGDGQNYDWQYNRNDKEYVEWYNFNFRNARYHVCRPGTQGCRNDEEYRRWYFRNYDN